MRANLEACFINSTQVGKHRLWFSGRPPASVPESASAAVVAWGLFDLVKRP